MRSTEHIGIIGAGHIGGTLTRRLRELGHDVKVANSRSPETLADLADETGATPVWAKDAAADADRAGQRPADYYAFAADTVFSSICIELVRASLGRSDVLSLPERFRTMITRLVEMLLR